MSLITERIQDYGRWRSSLLDAVERYRIWLAQSDLADPELQSRLLRIKDQLRDDRMSVAFVAEFSRGKSELINAIFFAHYGQRLLPSSAGRTTMCPTELLYDADQPIGVRLLPIETRLESEPLAELRLRPDKWVLVEADAADANSLKKALESVRQTKPIAIAEAIAMGMYDPNDDTSPYRPDGEGQIELPSWRHAIVNIPHPLLELGLVIVDTPGLNAIGAEPELTLKLIPSAHAVLFLLAADAGVTRSDIEIWRDHISVAHRTGRFVVLNKIDGLWDDLKDDAEIDLEISDQVASVAEMLGQPTERIYPVSAQKALVGKIRKDPALLERSRVPLLEHALSEEIVPQQQAIVCDQIRREFEETSGVTVSVLGARKRNLIDQARELEALRGKNVNVIEQMSLRIRAERASFDKSVRQLQALRVVFARHSQAILSSVGLDSLRRHVRDARDLMKTSALSTQLRDGMAGMIEAVRHDFSKADMLVQEVTEMMTAMYQRFSSEHGLTLGVPLPFALRRFFADIERIQHHYQRQFGTLTLWTTEKWALISRFFESVVVRFKEVYESAAREVAAWLRSLMMPIETQIREHQAQLRRRIESVQRVKEASGSLDSKLAELEQLGARIDHQLGMVNALIEQVALVMERSLSTGEQAPVIAAA